MTQEQYKYYTSGYDDGKQSTGDQYVQILLKKDQEIETLKAENSKMRNALEDQEWIPYKEGHPLPDYDEVVLWRDCEGNYLAEPLDKDGNPWLDEPLPVTHWKKIIPPKE